MSIGESVALRQLAEAIDALDRLKSFDYPVANSRDLKVEWRTGASCEGYKEMSAAISTIVSESYDTLRLDVLSRAEATVAERRQQLNALRSSKPE